MVKKQLIQLNHPIAHNIAHFIIEGNSFMVHS